MIINMWKNCKNKLPFLFFASFLCIFCTESSTKTWQLHSTHANNWGLHLTFGNKTHTQYLVLLFIKKTKGIL